MYVIVNTMIVIVNTNNMIVIVNTMKVIVNTMIVIVKNTTGITRTSFDFRATNPFNNTTGTSFDFRIIPGSLFNPICDKPAFGEGGGYWSKMDIG